MNGFAWPNLFPRRYYHFTIISINENLYITFEIKYFINCIRTPTLIINFNNNLVYIPNNDFTKFINLNDHLVYTLFIILVTFKTVCLEIYALIYFFNKIN